MAATKSLFDVQYHINARLRLPRPSSYEAAPLESAVRDLAGCGAGTRYLLRRNLEDQRVSLSDRERAAVNEVLLPGTGTGIEARRYTSRVPAPAAADAMTDDGAFWKTWDPHTEVTSDKSGTSASVWLRTDAPLARLAPKFDPQEWDTIGPGNFIEEAFGIHKDTQCAASHTPKPLDPNGYQCERIHEQVRSRIPGFDHPLSCDLKVSFLEKFEAPRPNFASYELVCNHEGLVNVNEGICYVREMPTPSNPHRLLYVRKAIGFTEEAPDFLKGIAPLVLPIWLMAMLVSAVNQVLGPPSEPSSGASK